MQEVVARYSEPMADGTKDPFDFPDDPLAGVDDLDIPSFGSPEEPPPVLPPLPRSAYLPPSAYEAWFVSAAHDERAIQAVLDALPEAALAAAAGGAA